MKIAALLFTGLICCTSMSAAFAQNLYEYRLKRFDTTNQIDRCNANAKSVGEKLAAAAQVTIISAGCQYQEYDEQRMTAVITYSAAAQVDITNVMTPYGDGVNNFAIYNSLESCDADKPRQITFFKRATGLEPLVTYCYRTSATTSVEYGLQIDAIGKTDKRHFISAINMYSNIAPVETNLLQHIADRMTALGTVVSDVRVGNGFAWKQIRFNYYATDRFNIDVNFSVRFESAEACRAELVNVNTAFMQASPNIIASYCEVGNGLNGNRLAVATAISYDTSISSVYQFHTLDSNYATRSACQADLGRLKDLLAAQGFNTIAILCGYNQRQFAAHVFLKK